MKVKCLYNTGKDLIKYQGKHSGVSKQLLTDSKNRSFWCTGETQFGELKIGKEYMVMGIIIRDGLPHYLMGDGDTFLYLLFEITDNKVNSNWYFRAFTKDDKNYINREAIWGYYELCFDENHLMQLFDREEKALAIYFKRKIEIENATAQYNGESI